MRFHCSTRSALLLEVNHSAAFSSGRAAAETMSGSNRNETERTRPRLSGGKILPRNLPATHRAATDGPWQECAAAKRNRPAFQSGVEGSCRLPVQRFRLLGRPLLIDGVPMRLPTMRAGKVATLFASSHPTDASGFPYRAFKSAGTASHPSA